MTLAADRLRRPSTEPREHPQAGGNPLPYVECDGDWCRPHPGVLEGVTAWLFTVQVEKRAVLEKLCRSIINDNALPSGGHAGQVSVKPLGGGFIVAIVHYDRAVSEPNADWGFLTYDEAGVFLPVSLEVNGKGAGYAGIVPYLFVDRFSPIATGRETFGFPKRLARIERGSTLWRVESDVVPKRPNPGAISEAVVLEVRGEGPFQEQEIEFSPEASIDARLQKIATEVVRGLGGADSVHLDPFRQATLLLLKQIRDAARPELACHRSVVAADFEVTGPPMAWVLRGAFSIDVSANAQPNMAASLGFQSAPATAAFRIRMDFKLARGRTLWS